MTKIEIPRWNERARPVLPSVTRPVILRILANSTLTESGCIEWNGYRDKFGYGRVTAEKSDLFTHRITWAWFNDSEIPEGMSVDHLCMNRACVNPVHLDICPIGENLRRSPTSMPSINKAKTHCYKGHLFAGENLVIDKSGYRACRTCRLEVKAAYRRRQRESVA